MTHEDLRVPFVRFRYLAIITGIVLAFLTVVALPYKYILNGEGHWTAYAWQAHGWLYIIYFIVTLDLGLRAKWSMQRNFLYLLAGTVPFMSFIAERKLRRELGF
jgi:integral membrane protein